jgi:hypothetical protein
MKSFIITNYVKLVSWYRKFSIYDTRVGRLLFKKKAAEHHADRREGIRCFVKNDPDLGLMFRFERNPVFD